MINDDTYVKQNFCEQELDRNYTVAKIDTVCSLTVGEYDINPIKFVCKKSWHMV